MIINKTFIGVLLALFSAASIAIGPILARISYSYGADVLSVTIFRGVIMIIICFLILLFKRKIHRPRNKTLLLTLGSGVAFAFMSFGYFESVNYLTVGLAISIYFLHPLLVSVASHFLRITPIKLSHIIAIVITLVGLYMVTESLGGNISQFGVFLAFLAALSVTAMILLNAKALEDSDPITINFLMVTVTTICLALFAIFDTKELNLPRSEIGWLSILGVGVTFSFGLMSFFYSVSMIGAVKSTMITCLQPAFATIFAAIILAEFLSLQQISGILIIIVGLICRDATA